MRRTISIIFLLLISTFSFTFSQVVIKEKVEIKPKINSNNYNNLSLEHIFTYKVTWIPTENYRCNIQIITCSNDTLNTGWSTNGIASISFVGNGRHHYLIEGERWFYRYIDGWHWVESSLPGGILQIFVDGIEIYNPGLLGTFSGVNGNFNLNINGTVSQCKFASLSINHFQWAECNGPNWYETDPLTLEIIEGNNYAFLYDVTTGANLGSFVQLTKYSDIQNIALKGNESAPIVTSPQTIKLKASINGVIETAETEFPSNTFTIYPWIYKDTIYSGTRNHIDLDIVNFCKNLSDEIKINAEIIGGNKYGNLVNVFTGEELQSLTGLEHDLGYTYFDYIADGIKVDSTDSVKIRISTTDSNIPTKDITMFIKPTPLEIFIEPTTIQPGDTAKITIKKRNPDGSLTDFPPEQIIEIGTVEGCAFGKILACEGSECTLEPYFYGISEGGPLYFIADSSADTGTVKIRVGLIEDAGGGVGASKIYQFDKNKTNLSKKEKSVLEKNNTGFVNQGNILKEQSLQRKTKLVKAIEERINNSTLPSSEKEKIIDKLNVARLTTSIESDYCLDVDFESEIFADSPLKVKKEEPINILLGETKYFQAKKDTNTGEIKIVEIKPDVNGVPQKKTGTENEWQWLTDNTVWGDNPVSVDTGKNYGKRMGVYWETDKPVWVDTIKKENLTIGLVRLVGRYWSKDSTYVVILKVRRNNGDSASIKIKVIKPKKLGDEHPKALDVFGYSLNVDSLCSYDGGEIGVPPQILEGHMEKETNFQNSFRYEPRLDINTQNDPSEKKKYLDDYPYYTVTSSSMGTIAMPDNHTNVKPVSYSTSPIKIGDYLVEKIANYIRYPKKDKDGNWLDPFFIGYKNSEPSKKLQKAYNKMRDSLGLNGAMQYAIDSLKKWLKTDDFKDGKKYVQSRIFSSYGMLQQIFYFACTDNIAGYAISNDKQTPETLNEIKYSIKAYKENMLKKIKNMSGNQWQDGFEGVWIKILQSYNSGELGYGKSTLKLSNKYLPK